MDFNGFKEMHKEVSCVAAWKQNRNQLKGGRKHNLSGILHRKMERNHRMLFKIYFSKILSQAAEMLDLCLKFEKN